MGAPVAPICCVSACPDEAPFFNPATCGCVPGYVEQEPSYATASYAEPTESYGESTQQSGYRKLQDYGYGGEVATASYGAAAFTSGPDGTIDTRNMRINRTGLIVLWVAFAILFLLACYYLRMFHWYYTISEDSDDSPIGYEFGHDTAAEKQYVNHNAGEFRGSDHPHERDGVKEDETKIHHSILHFLANPSLIAGCVCLIASLAYLTMATNNGWYTRCHDGRQFFFARYIDWIITTPLMLHAIAHFGNAPDDAWNFLFFSDVLRIASGLVASTIDGGEKWIYYGFSVLAFIPVLYYICKIRNYQLDNRKWDKDTGLLAMWPWSTNDIHLPYIWFFHRLELIADLTVLAWFCYPIVWIFAEGTNKMSVTAEAITYTILDLISKGVFGWFIVHSYWENPYNRFHNRYVVKVTDTGVTNGDPLNDKPVHAGPVN